MSMLRDARRDWQLIKGEATGIALSITLHHHLPYPPATPYVPNHDIKSIDDWPSSKPGFEPLV